MSLLSTSLQAGSSKRQQKICATCLSLCRDDQLNPFTEELKITLKHLLHDFDLDGCFKLVPPENGVKLCRSCLKTLQDIHFFKQNALKSLNYLKKQREQCLQKKQSEQNMPEDEILVTTAKVEIKAEQDPLEWPKDFVIGQKAGKSNVSIGIKKESRIDNYNNDRMIAESNVSVNIKNEIDIDNDHTIGESNIDTEFTDLDDIINASSIMKTVNSRSDVKRANYNSECRNASDIIENAVNFFVNKHMENTQNTMNSMVNIAPKPEPSLGKTSHSSHTSVENKPVASSYVGSSALASFSLKGLLEAKSRLHVGRYTAVKEQSDTQINQNEKMSRDIHISDTESDSGVDEKSVKKNNHMKKCMKVLKVNSRNEFYGFSLYENDTKVTILAKPWYITSVTREQLVKIREDKMKDPSFAEADFKCTYCAHTFANEGLWERHKYLCHGMSKENAEFTCFVCSLSFDTLQLLSSHMSFHSLGHHTYQCSNCEFTMKTNLHYVPKRLSHWCPNKGGEKVPPMDPTMKLTTGRRQYYCPACDYVSFHPINSHYERFHSNSGTVKCEICGHISKCIESLRQHKRIKHSDNPPEKKEVMFCAPCALSFYSISAYHKHITTTVKHAPKDQVKISCDECSRKFHLQELYEKHKKLHELVRSGTKPHKCTQCGSSYTTKPGLRAHIRTKHTKREIKRDHICDVCGEGFPSGVILRAHMARHSDERPYKCEYCGDTFKYSGARYTHIKLKHKKKKTISDDGNKGTRKSARNRKRRIEKGDEHEQSEDENEQSEHTHEQTMGTHEQSQWRSYPGARRGRAPAPSSTGGPSDPLQKTSN